MGRFRAACFSGRQLFCWLFPRKGFNIRVGESYFSGTFQWQNLPSTFRGLFAFYAAKAHHDHNVEGEESLLKLFGSVDGISDRLLQSWSEKADLLGPEIVGDMMEPRAHRIAEGNLHYDHASDFLHALLRDLGRKVQ